MDYRVTEEPQLNNRETKRGACIAIKDNPVAIRGVSLWIKKWEEAEHLTTRQINRPDNKLPDIKNIINIVRALVFNQEHPGSSNKGIVIELIINSLIPWGWIDKFGRDCIWGEISELGGNGHIGDFRRQGV